MRTRKFTSFKSKEEVLILDGGFATTLESRGHMITTSLWSAEALCSNPQAVVEVHEEFITSGCDIITTASYQISYDGFLRYGYNHSVTNSTIVASTVYAVIARNMTMGDTLIASSIGCYGAHLADGSEYVGCYGKSVDYLYNWHIQKLQTILSTSPDLLAFETIPCVQETKAIIKLLHKYDEENIPISGWMSFACKNAAQMNSGESVENALRALHDTSYDDPTTSSNTSSNVNSFGVGFNCTDPSHISGLLEAVSDFNNGRKSNRPVVVYPNSGEVWNASLREWERDQRLCDESFACLAQEWVGLGASVVGGCCRTGPDTTRELKRVLGGGGGRGDFNMKGKQTI